MTLAEEDLTAAFRSDLAASLTSVPAGTYGYALLTGEEPELAAACSVTNSESAIGSKPELPDVEHRYFPDEWTDWQYDSFKQFNQLLEQVWSDWPSSGASYVQYVHQFYLQQLAAHPFPNGIWYRVIWVSDSSTPIVNQSFKELNGERAHQEAGHFFGVGTA